MSAANDDARDPELDRQRASEALDRNAPYIGKTLGSTLDLIEARADGRLKPIPTPWKSLNDTLGGGLWPGLHVLTGTTGAGKTQFALQTALRAAFAKCPTLYIALELSREEVQARTVALVLSDEGDQVHWSDLFLGKSRPALERARAIGANRAHPLNTLMFRIEEGEARRWSVSDLSYRVGAMRERGSLVDATPLVVLDYLQALGPEPGEQRRVELRERIAQAAFEARNAAKQGAAVLLLSSVSREGAKLLAGEDRLHRGNGEPYDLVGLGKESGEIEYSADTVLALSRAPFDARGTEMDLAVAKVRAGRTAWVPLVFNGSSFSESVAAAPRPPPTTRSSRPTPFSEEDEP